MKMLSIVSSLLVSLTAIADENKVTQGSMRCFFPDRTNETEAIDLPLKHTDVKAEISGFVTRVKVTQTFTNPYTDPLEAIYVFPLPQNAAVNDMQIMIGDRVIKGEIKKREEARKIYEDAKRAGKTAALLDQERPNIFTQSIANIMPGNEIKVEITYDEVLTYEKGGYEFVFPMVVGPRFIPENVPDADRISPPVLKPGERNGHDISLSVRINSPTPLINIESPTHKITTTTHEITLAPSDTIPNKDFVLRYKLAGDDPQFGALCHQGELGGYFMLMFQPPEVPKPETVTPKEMVFVVDCSGSMNGEPITLAKKAMRYALENLNENDTFQVIRFSEMASPFSPEPLPATKENIRRGLSYINGLSGEGGTRMIEGIKASLDYPHRENRLRIVCFMTDGYIGNEAEILGAIQEKLGDNTRLFSFGVGSSVNRYLLDSMAEVGLGEVQYVTLNENPEQQVNKFYERVRNPVLTHIRVDWSDLDVKELTPGRILDLFSGQPIFLLGRYDKAGEATIKIHAKANGEDVTYEVPVKLTSDEPENAALAALWARSQIKELSTENYRGEQKDVVEKITNLALKYRLMSQYTSFVAVEEKIVNEGGELKTIQVPVEMPEGVSYEGVFGRGDGNGGGSPFGATAAAPARHSRGLFSYISQAPVVKNVKPVTHSMDAEEHVMPEAKKNLSFSLEWKTVLSNGWRVVIITIDGDVWQDTLSADGKIIEHLMVTRLTHEQQRKLFELLQNARMCPSTKIAYPVTGSFVVRFYDETGKETFGLALELNPEGAEIPDWDKVLKQISTVTH